MSDFDHVINLTEQGERVLVEAMPARFESTRITVRTAQGGELRLSIDHRGKHPAITVHLEEDEQVAFHAVSNDGECWCQPLYMSGYTRLGPSGFTIPDEKLPDGRYTVFARGEVFDHTVGQAALDARAALS